MQFLNFNLYMWHINESSDCQYCQQVDTIEHAFDYRSYLNISQFLNHNPQKLWHVLGYVLH